MQRPVHYGTTMYPSMTVSSDPAHFNPEHKSGDSPVALRLILSIVAIHESNAPNVVDMAMGCSKYTDTVRRSAFTVKGNTIRMNTCLCAKRSGPRSFRLRQMPTKPMLRWKAQTACSGPSSNACGPLTASLLSQISWQRRHTEEASVIF